MSNLHSHVGIPKCLLLEFAIKDQIQVFDTVRNKVYSSNCDRAGTINHYYTEEVEKLLSERVEDGLADLIKELRKCKNNCDYTNCLNSHCEIIEAFFKFQLQRSRKMLGGLNKKSLYAKSLGPLSHSELLKIIDKISANILGTLGERLFAIRIVCEGDQFLITNSLGFYFVLDNKRIRYFVVPLSNKDAICIQSDYDKTNPVSHYIMDQEINDYFNKSCYQFELQLGNGCIYAKEKKELDSFLKKEGLEPNGAGK